MQEEVKKILENIFSKLKNNPSDVDFLFEQINKYEHHQYKDEIISQIIEKLNDYSNQKNLEIYNDTLKQELDFKMGKALKLISHQKLDEGKEILLSITKKIDNLFIQDYVNEYFSFINPIEELIYLNVFKENNKITNSIGPIFTDCYLTIGLVYLELMNKAAIEYLEKAIKWNPFNMKARFTLIEFYLKEDIDKSLELLNESYPYIYDSFSLFKYYQLLASYYISNNNLEKAINIYVYSTKFIKNEEVFKKIYELLKNETKKINPTLQESFNYLKKENIPTNITENNMNIIYTIYLDCMNNNEQELEKMTRNILFNLTKSDEFTNDC